MERQVTAQAWIEDGIMRGVLLAVGRVHCLHSEVETQDEEVEVEPHAQSVSHGNILEKAAEAKLSSRLVVIVSQSPNVSGINEECARELPEEPCPVLHIQVELHVTRLIDKINSSVLAGKASRAEPPDRPSPDTVCPSREIPLLEGKDVTVAIGVCNANPCMQHELVVIVELYVSREDDVCFHVLCIGDV